MEMSISRAAEGSVMISDGAISMKVQALHVFMYLQLLDFITTLTGFRVGAAEASPFVAGLIHLSSAELGVGMSKLVAVGLGAVCVFTHRPRMLGWINCWYAGVVLWNFLMIGLAMHVHAA